MEFRVQQIEVERGWAFVQAIPQRKGGQPIDGQKYFGKDWEYMDGLTVTAVLRYQNHRWNLVDKAIGATDAWQCASPAKFLLSYC